jgi:hypothetical protein
MSTKVKYHKSMAVKAKIISEEFVKRVVIRHLANLGWSKNLTYDDLRMPGVDIKVTNSQYSRTFFTEAKGASSYRSGFEVAFVYSPRADRYSNEEHEGALLFWYRSPKKECRYSDTSNPVRFCSSRASSHFFGRRQRQSDLVQARGYQEISKLPCKMTNSITPLKS